jgi:predicted Rossmann-fold nucleotide-binding protein
MWRRKGMRVIIAGSRDFDDYEFMKKELAEFAKECPITEVVSGTADGADTLGEKYAEENGLPVTKFVPEWDKLGKIAGNIRNEKMAQNADACIVFMKGFSQGSQNMADTARKYKLPTRVLSI